MAGLDYGAILRGAPAMIADPAEDDGRALQAQEGRLRLATLAQQYQQGQQAAQRQEAQRTALAGAVGPDGKVDYGRVGAAMLQAGDLDGYTSLQTTQANQAKAQREARSSQIDYEVKAFDAVDRSLAGLSALLPEQRPAAWAAERQRLAGFLDEETLGELPEEVDDRTIMRFRLHAMDGKERATVEQQEWERQFKTAEFGYRQANDAANRSVTMRGQNLTDARSRSSEAASGYRLMTPAEKRAAGLPTGGVFQVNPKGQISGVSGAGGLTPSADAQKAEIGAGVLTKTLARYKGMLSSPDGKRDGYNPRNPIDRMNGTTKAALNAAYKTAQLQLKDLNALGVIAGPDMELIEGQLIDPTSFKASRVGVEGLFAGIQQVEQFIKDRVETQRAYYSGQNGTPSADADPLGIR